MNGFVVTEPAPENARPVKGDGSVVFLVVQRQKVPATFMIQVKKSPASESVEVGEACKTDAIDADVPGKRRGPDLQVIA